MGKLTGQHASNTLPWVNGVRSRIHSYPSPCFEIVTPLTVGKLTDDDGLAFDISLRFV